METLKKSKQIHQFMSVLFMAAFFTAVLTWPFILHIGSFYTDHGDYPLAGSVLWYNQDSLKNGRIANQEEYFRGYQFYPQPFSLAFANNSLAPQILFAPIYWLSNNLALSVNLYAFLTLVLSFITSFYVFKFFVKNFWAALVGALIFTFNPQTMVRFPEHLDILGKYWLPLMFLYAYKLFNKPNPKNAFLFWLFFTLNALTVNYYQIFSIVLLPFAAVPFLWVNSVRKNWSYFISLAKASSIFLLLLSVLVYFNLPYLEFNQKEGVYRPLESTVFFSARVNDWFTASPDNLLYGNWVKSIERYREPKDSRGILNYEEHTLFVGLLALCLFILGWKLFVREKINHAYFWILLVLPFLLTFGPYFNGQTNGLPMPFYALYKLVPFMEGIRAPGRFEFVFFVPFGLICAFGAKYVIERFKSNKVAVLVILILGLVLENLTIKNFDLQSDIFAKIQGIGRENLAFLNDREALHFPIYSVEDADNFGNNSAYTNWATQTGEKIVNGDTAYLPPDQLALMDWFKEDLNEPALAVLSSLGVDFIVIHKDRLSGNDLANYQRNLSLYQKGAVLDSNEVLIVDLSSFKFDLPLCSLERDFDIKPVKTTDDNGSISYAFVLENKNDCYLLSTYEEKYRHMEVILDGSIKKAYFKVPVVIMPHQQIILSESRKELRLE